MMRMVFFQKDAKLPQEGNRKNATHSENHRIADKGILSHIYDINFQFWAVLGTLGCKEKILMMAVFYVFMGKKILYRRH